MIVVSLTLIIIAAVLIAVLARAEERVGEAAYAQREEEPDPWLIPPDWDWPING